MTTLGLLLWITLGIGVQLALFVGIGLWQALRSYRRIAPGESQVAAELPAISSRSVEPSSWSGFRSFTVVRRVLEDSAGQICSFYLEPTDRQPLPPYKPGQFLTFRLDLPAAAGIGNAQISRCYSLSDAPSADHYRVSIKRVPPPPNSAHPPGRSSNFFHDHVQVGTTMQVRAPSGHFHLEPGSSPVVLIAGGIGITPMLSMLNWCQAFQPEREVWFFYGVRNSREAAFAGHLRAIAAANPNVHLQVCFSDPLPEDRLDRDFHHCGRVAVPLLRAQLPLRPYHYYICGPAPMMGALVTALEDWGVPGARIHFEAFGPASITRRKPEPPARDAVLAAAAGDITVTFAKSGKQAPWSPLSSNLLVFAESHGIAIDSSCRAGSCGTCQTTLRSGAVTYQQAPEFDPEPGTCLLCVSTPASDVTLDA
jgi:ferredoxin-NADP reductase